jgi:chromosome segregation ATPase
LESLRNTNFDLNEKIWKLESELSITKVDLNNKNSENEKVLSNFETLREENERLKKELEKWKEDFHKENQRNIYLEKENSILDERNKKLEDEISGLKSRLTAKDDEILKISKVNSSLETSKNMLEERVKGMEKEIERMNNMVSVTQSQIGHRDAEQRSNLFQSEHNFPMNTTFASPNKNESSLVQGLNNQLADLRNEKEELKEKYQREQKEKDSHLGMLEHIQSKMERLKNENKYLKEENKELLNEKTSNFKKGNNLEKKILQEIANKENEEFKNKLLEEKLAELKEKIAMLQESKRDAELESEKKEGLLTKSKEDWEKQNKLNQEFMKREEMQKDLLLGKIKNKDEFIQKILETLKLPKNNLHDWNSQR